MRVSLKHFTGGLRPPPLPIDPKTRSRQIGIGGHANSESLVTLNRNARSRSTGIRTADPGTDKADLFREAMKVFVRVQAGKRLAALGGKAPRMKSVPRRRPL